MAFLHRHPAFRCFQPELIYSARWQVLRYGLVHIYFTGVFRLEFWRWRVKLIISCRHIKCHVKLPRSTRSIASRELYIWFCALPLFQCLHWVWQTVAHFSHSRILSDLLTTESLSILCSGAAESVAPKLSKTVQGSTGDSSDKVGIWINVCEFESVDHITCSWKLW